MQIKVLWLPSQAVVSTVTVLPMVELSTLNRHHTLEYFVDSCLFTLNVASSLEGGAIRILGR